MSQDHKILLCLPNSYAEKFNAELRKVYPDLKILGNAPSYNLLVKAFDAYSPNVVIIHIDVPATHDIAYEAVSLSFALDYIRGRNKKVKIILIHGEVKIKEQDEFNYKILDVNVIPKNDVLPREIGQILGLEKFSDFVQPIVSVFSLKGGAGKSTVASNLGILLKETATPPVQFYSGYLQRQVDNLKVLIWDMDIQNGDMGITFNVPPSKNIYELMTKESVIDITNIIKYIHTTDFGVDVLAAPPRFDKFQPMTEENFNDILVILKQLYHVIIFDLPTEVINRPLSFSSLKNSSIVLNVFTPNKKGIKSALVSDKLFQFLPNKPDIIQYVLNRTEDPRVDLRHITKLIGNEVNCILPDLKQIEILEDQDKFAVDTDKIYRENMLNMAKQVLPYFFVSGTDNSNTIAPVKKKFSLFGNKESKK